MIEAVLFDVAGVLLIPHPEPITAALHELGIEIGGADFERAHYAGVASIEDLVEESMPRLPYLETYAAEIGVPEPRRRAAAEALLSLFDSQPLDVFRLRCRGVPEGMQVLVDKGIKCAVVSNSDGSVAQQLSAGRVCQVGKGDGVSIRAIVDSAVVGVSKPDRKIFDIGLAAVATLPFRAAYVGDSVMIDVDGAQRAGMHALHFDPFDFCARDDHDHITSLYDVVAWVDKRRS